jgi:hypothetical protein
MTLWYSKRLGDAMYGLEATLETLEAAFQDEYALAGSPLDMAVFTRLESEGRLHCELVVYFSPAAHRSADRFRADPCERPLRAGLDLLAGQPACWSVLFPESSG